MIGWNLRFDGSPDDYYFGGSLDGGPRGGYFDGSVDGCVDGPLDGTLWTSSLKTAKYIGR